ncbi:MAG: dipeptidase [Weeksellaceae bacterium]
MKRMNIDLHCDLLTYFLYPNANSKDDLGCSVPYLLEGNVAIQTMAIYSATTKGSVNKAFAQLDFYRKLLNNEKIYQVTQKSIENLTNDTLGIICAIENDSCLCEEDDPLDNTFRNLDRLIEHTSNVLYLSLTHSTENRFGGGNNTDIGLKEDGKNLIDYLVSKNIAIDLSHTSDKLVYDIINYIDKRNHKISILASHSNSRKIYNNNRNLPDELMLEIINRKGLIGLNFIKDYIDPLNSKKLYQHIEHILSLGGESSLCYGADFFFDKAHPDQSRYPFFFDDYKNALSYNCINENISDYYGSKISENISHVNALNFIKASL